MGGCAKAKTSSKMQNNDKSRHKAMIKITVTACSPVLERRTSWQKSNISPEVYTAPIFKVFSGSQLFSE